MIIVPEPRPIRPIPCDGANFIVTVDGIPYAGFVSRTYAEMAVGLWTGAINGGGLPVLPHERERHGWPAARGRLLDIVERGSRAYR